MNQQRSIKCEKGDRVSHCNHGNSIVQSVLSEGAAINNTLDVMNYRNDDHQNGLVVYDRDLQPDGEWCWLYYVFGKRLVWTSLNSKSKLYSVSNREYLLFAKEQYQAWNDNNENQILDKMDSEPLEESRPPSRSKCLVCNGDSVVYWSTGSAAAWQGSSDRQNFRDICEACRGAGFVDNIL
jgi:hypothetical protein